MAIERKVLAPIKDVPERHRSEGAGKLTSVGTNVMGMTGRAILEALGAGQTDPVQLSELVCGSLKRRKQELAQAATHRQYLLKLHLGLHDAQAIASLGGQL